MKKIVYGILILILMVAWACNQTKDSSEEENREVPENATNMEEPNQDVEKKAEKAIEKEAQNETIASKDAPQTQQTEEIARDNQPTTDEKVSTNYYDLPESKANQLQDILNANSLQKLENKNLKPMQNYFMEKVLQGKTQFGSKIKINYFWYVYNALPDFVSSKERHTGYHSHQEPESEKDALLAYSIYRLDRSPENLKRLFKYSKILVNNVIPDDVLQRIKPLIEKRIRSYEAMQKYKDYDSKLTEFYNKYFTPNGEIKDPELIDGAYGFPVYEMEQKLYQFLFPNGLMGDPPAHLSFWMRRNHEGNMDAVYEILKELNAMI